MAKMHELADLGQSIWLDYIRRSLITSGELQELIDKGLRGVTSNPSIFEKAISESSDYDGAMQKLVAEGKSVSEIYETLVIQDVRCAADLMKSVYDATGGTDGYVSLEVNPELAYDTDGTIAEARYLFSALGRPNVMIKVPATNAGFPAMELLISEGINVNATLIFSLAQYEAVAQAYIAGLEELVERGDDPSRVSSVASFFVSRIDTAVDHALEEIEEKAGPGALILRGKIAIASAKVVYARFREIFSGSRWEQLAALGARVQRPLWGSTSTKNPLYSDTLYVDNLIGRDSVNTLPPATLEAFLNHGRAALTLETDPEEARSQLDRLPDLGVELDAITQQLQDDGVGAFAKAFETLIARINERRQKFLSNG